MDFNVIVCFLIDNWSYISSAILFVVSLLAIILKRRPKKYDEFVSCVSQCLAGMPFFIAEAEVMKTPDENGEDKKSLCLGWSFQKLENMLKRELTRDEELYAFKAFSSMIEKVLSCPTKKGGLGREKDE